MLELAKQIHVHLTCRAQRIVVVPHKNPDGDTLGAAVAFLHYLRGAGVNATLWCKTGATTALTFLPHAHDLRSDPAIWTDMQFDTVCVFDAGDIAFAGALEPLNSLAKKPTIINFDHHLTNTHFGDYNFVDTAAASTTEVLYHYFKANKIDIDSETATALLTGLMTDTGNFSNPATSESALRVGAELMRSGGNYGAILNYTYRNKSADALKLWGIALSRLIIKKELDLAYTVLLRSDMEGLLVTDGDIEGVANFLNSIGDTKISMVLKETQDGLVKGSLRTTANDVDVAAIAGGFGGGGHKKASGFSMRGKLEFGDGDWHIVDAVPKIN